MLYIILLLLTECEYWDFIKNAYGIKKVFKQH